MFVLHHLTVAVVTAAAGSPDQHQVPVTSSRSSPEFQPRGRGGSTILMAVLENWDQRGSGVCLWKSWNSDDFILILGKLASTTLQAGALMACSNSEFTVQAGGRAGRAGVSSAVR